MKVCKKLKWLQKALPQIGIYMQKNHSAIFLRGISLFEA